VKKQKLILRYLASLAMDLVKEVDSPMLVNCGSEAEGQLWAADQPLQWHGAAPVRKP